MINSEQLLKLGITKQKLRFSLILVSLYFNYCCFRNNFQVHNKLILSKLEPKKMKKRALTHTHTTHKVFSLEQSFLKLKVNLNVTISLNCSPIRLILLSSENNLKCASRISVWFCNGKCVTKVTSDMSLEWVDYYVTRWIC